MTALRALLGAGVLLCLWQGIVWFWQIPPFILPGPLRVAEALWANRALIADHAGVTATEVLAGLVLGGALGWISAVGLARSPLARSIVQPVMVLSQAVPVFALAPILTLWLGYGIGSKIVMTILIIYFPVTSSFLDALLRTPPGLLAQARVMGASEGRILWHLRIPAALPGFLSGLKLAAVYAPIGAIIGEWVGASRGLGYLMLLANGRTKTDLMFAALAVLAVLAVALHVAVGRAADAWLRRRDA